MADTQPLLTKDQQISMLTRSLDTRGRALKLAFALVGALIFALLIIGSMLRDTNNDLGGGIQDDRDYRQEERYLDCFLAQDDARIAPPEVAEKIEELCKGVELPN